MEQSSQNPSFGQGLELNGIITKAIASAVKKTNADLDRVQTVIGKPGVIFQLVEDLFAEEGKIKKNTPILRLISGNSTLMIEALDGKACISEAKETFGLNISSFFKNWGLDKPGPATAETFLNVSEIDVNGTFIQIFTGITPDLDKLVMTQTQIIYFCKKHRNWLCKDGYGTFFLTKVDSEYFVVSVVINEEGFLGAYVNNLEYNNGHSGVGNQYIVYPKLMTSVKTVEEKPAMLKLISYGERIMIEELDGKASISDAKKTFKSVIDSRFKNWGLNQPTPETLLDICEMNSDGTFIQIFTGISNDLDKIVMSQSQIIRFCEKYFNLLRKLGLNTFFLTKTREEYFVVVVSWNIDGLSVYLRCFGQVRDWHCEDCRNHVVYPQLTTSVKTVEEKLAMLKLLSGGEKIMIGALDGKERISSAKKTFKSFTCPNPKKWELNHSILATTETLFDVSEIVGAGTFNEIFAGVSSDLEKLVMTQSQIIRFCEERRSWLSFESCHTFFLTKVSNEYFVIGVYERSDGLQAVVRFFKNDYVWGGKHGKYSNRVVYPKLMPLCKPVEEQPALLKLISGGEKLMIEALDGKTYISNAKKTFEAYIDSDFKSWGFNQYGPATTETLFDVNEMISDGTFVQIFTGITPDLDKLVMTQSQIIRFCEKYPVWVSQGGRNTFFLTKVGDEYFVVYVYTYSNRLDVKVQRFEHHRVWLGKDRYRVVYPKLMPTAE